MLLSYLKEFESVARYLNLSKAAVKLSMSQPALSRHMSQLEADLGFKIFSRSKNSISLTEAGRQLANGFSDIDSELNALLDECRTIASNRFGIIKIQDVPYQGEYIAKYYETINKIIGTNKYNAEFVILSRISLIDALSKDIIDIGFLYSFNDPSSWLDKSLKSIYFYEVELGVWVHKENHLFFDIECVTKDDLDKLRILLPNDSYHPLRDAVIALYDSYGLAPKFHLVNTKTPAEFRRLDYVADVFLTPSSSKIYDAHLSSRDDLRFVPLAKDLSFKAYALYKSNRFV